MGQKGSLSQKEKEGRGSDQSKSHECSANCDAVSVIDIRSEKK